MVNYTEDNVTSLAQRDYDSARRKAFWRKVRQSLGRKCNDLLPAHPVLENLAGQEPRDLGLQQVPLDRIIGSSGRYRDFDLAFLPLRQESDGRWLNIAQAHRQHINLPPPRLYQVGDAYFVEDGNHRVSVARAKGQETIEAYVIALDTSELEAKPSCTRLGFKIENGANCSP